MRRFPIPLKRGSTLAAFRMDTIREVYDVRVSQAYANDLLAFSEKAAKGDA